MDGGGLWLLSFPMDGRPASRVAAGEARNPGFGGNHATCLASSRFCLASAAARRGATGSKFPSCPSMHRKPIRSNESGGTCTKRSRETTAANRWTNSSSRSIDGSATTTTLSMKSETTTPSPPSAPDPVWSYLAHRASKCAIGDHTEPRMCHPLAIGGQARARRAGLFPNCCQSGNNHPQETPFFDFLRI